MKEINDIIRAYDKAVSEGRQAALATVVHVEGSSYRRAGARMLIEDNGQLTGAISGGCLEGDALRKALSVMQQQRSMLVTYDTMDDDDAKLGVGLGCNGIIQVLIEPVQQPEKDLIAMLRQIKSDREESVLVTLFSLVHKKNEQPGTCLFQKTTGKISTTIKSASLLQYLSVDIEETFRQRTSEFKNYIGENFDLTAFIEFIPPPVSLVIAGAGNDIIPLVKMADILGWQTTVIDGRPAYAKAERFPQGCNVMLLNPENVLKNINIDDHTVFLLMTHNYNYDLSLLKLLLSQNISFTGILGPRKKWERMMGDLQDNGITLSAAQLSSIHSPVGLDIGAETPEEIALSILAEIKAVLAKKNGVQLKNKTTPIHEDDITIQKIPVN